jgi:2-polyprenyl-3-methyl-5-hydroxy-6-metoxy-1,4-benzoquinol methylase
MWSISSSLLDILSVPRLLNHRHSAMAAAHSNKNEKTTEKLIAELRSRLEWISADFLDCSKDEEGSSKAEKIESKSMRILDYGCGPGMISRVSPLFSSSNPFSSWLVGTRI